MKKISKMFVLFFSLPLLFIFLGISSVEAWTITGTQIDSPGWWTYIRQNESGPGVIERTTSEYSPNSGPEAVSVKVPANACSVTWCSGDPGGWGYSVPETREYWIQFWFKYKDNFDGHPVGNKLVYINRSASYTTGRYLMLIDGPTFGNEDYMRPVVSAYWLDKVNAVWLYPNIQATPITKGAWHKFKVHHNMDTGVYEYWLDDIKQAYYTTAIYPTTVDGQQVSLGEVNFTPVWGGQGATGPSVDDYVYYDDVYISNDTPPGGSSGGGGCTPNWSCGNWNTCINNQQIRTCTDSNSCGTTSGKPTTSQSCTSEICGNNICGSGENSTNCPADCSASAKTYTLSDFTNLVTDWLKTISNSPADTNLDNKVNSRDLGIMMSNWGTSTPDPTGNLTIRAKGVVGDETIDLKVNDNTIQTWTLATSYQDYSASATVSDSDAITVNFTNDAGDRDVQVDYLKIDNTTYQAENQTTNTGGWNFDTAACGGVQSEWLHCGGYIQFQGGTVPPQEPCGNGSCLGGETCSTCSKDCGTCPSNCANLNFNSGSVTPATVNPGGSYTMQCDYEAAVDSINPIVGSGSCVYSNYSGNTANFSCTAGSTTGIFTNSCSLVTGTTNNTCARTDAINSLTVSGTPSDYCGDQSCNNGETCSTCLRDCGSCAGWTLDWSDEFDQAGCTEQSPCSPDMSKWIYEVSHPTYNNMMSHTDNDHYYKNDRPGVWATDRLANVRVENGTLIQERHNDNYEGHGITGSYLRTAGGYSDITADPWVVKKQIMYGKLEARVKMDDEFGMWSSLWTGGVGADAWPNNGEIDIFEQAAWSHPKYIGFGGAWASGPSNKLLWGSGVPWFDVTQYHTYTMEWYPGRLEFYIDGSHLGTISPSNLPNYSYDASPQDIRLFGSWWTNNPPDGRTPDAGYYGNVNNLPKRTTWDYVRYYTWN